MVLMISCSTLLYTCTLFLSYLGTETSQKFKLDIMVIVMVIMMTMIMIMTISMVIVMIMIMTMIIMMTTLMVIATTNFEVKETWGL